MLPRPVAAAQSPEAEGAITPLRGQFHLPSTRAALSTPRMYRSALFPEIWAAVAGVLIEHSGPAGMLQVVKLGLTCRTLCALLVDNDASWRARCHRDFGAARAELHIERERLGMSWLCLYAAMGLDADAQIKRRRLRPITTPTTCYGTQHYEGRLVYGRFYSRPVGPACRRHWQASYLVSIDVTCEASGGDVVIIERSTADDKSWVHLRRLTDRDLARRCRVRSTSWHPNRFCSCDRCDRYPGAHPLRYATTYAGGWRDANPDGRGRAVFPNGLVYDGEWKHGLPNGEGSLDGVIRRWHNGYCIAVTTAPHDFAGGCYEGDLLLVDRGSRDPDVVPPCDNSLWLWLKTRGGGRAGQQPSESHGWGTAAYEDGSVYTGQWHYGKPRLGRLVLANGTVLDGKWGIELGEGTLSWASGARIENATWDMHNRLRLMFVNAARIPTYADMRHLCTSVNGDSCSCAACSVLAAMYVTLPNGDTCASRWSGTRQGELRDIDSFVFSPRCSVTAFVGKRIDGCAWTCRRVSVAVANRYMCPDDYIYWPADQTSADFHLFDTYVRARLIGWPCDAIVFYLACHDGVANFGAHEQGQPIKAV